MKAVDHNIFFKDVVVDGYDGETKAVVEDRLQQKLHIRIADVVWVIVICDNLFNGDDFRVHTRKFDGSFFGFNFVDQSNSLHLRIVASRGSS